MAKRIRRDSEEVKRRRMCLEAVGKIEISAVQFIMQQITTVVKTAETFPELACSKAPRSFVQSKPLQSTAAFENTVELSLLSFRDQTFPKITIDECRSLCKRWSVYLLSTDFSIRF